MSDRWAFSILCLDLKVKLLIRDPHHTVYGYDRKDYGSLWWGFEAIQYSYSYCKTVTVNHIYKRRAKVRESRHGSMSFFLPSCVCIDPSVPSRTEPHHSLLSSRLTVS